MKKILVVDDDREVRELLKERLERANYEVSTASHGQRAVSICKSNPPDLILLDIAMPEMDGYAVAEALGENQATEDIPTLFLSGKELDMKSVSERVGELSAHGFIMKTCDFKELLSRIREIIG